MWQGVWCKIGITSGYVVLWHGLYYCPPLYGAWTGAIRIAHDAPGAIARALTLKGERGGDGDGDNPR